MTTLIAWALIFIDGATDEGSIIKFLLDGLHTSNLKNKIIDLITLIAITFAGYLLFRQNFNSKYFAIIYLILLLKIIRHIKIGHYSWFLDTRTIVPFIIFLFLAFVSIWTQNTKTNKT